MRRRGWLRLPAVLLLLVQVACATAPGTDVRDPLEPLNRSVFRFNEALDGAVLRPAATVYRDKVPTPMRQGIGNVFANLTDAWSAVNNALQLKAQATLDSTMRVVVNSVLGLGGVFDVASEMSIERHTRDFGHTLGRWGVGPGPYLVLPVVGASTLRDTVALPLDWQGDLVTSLPSVPARNAAVVLRGVDTRAGLLKATTMLEQVALDPYTFTRDAYLQKRRNDIYDGNPPEDPGESPLP
ncbi:MAG: VacJ family lipoprotein [Rhodoferax sp.]|nr:VacJ family lipoprotein [Rhodoferax sp.]